MKPTVCIVLLGVVILLSACIKDTSGSQPMLVQSISIDSNACVINYTYDNFNRLTSIVQCDTTETFAYSHDTVYDIKVSAGVQAYENIYTLNSAGLATGCISFGAGGISASYVLTYDAAGHLLSSVDTTHPNTATSYVIQNGNIIQETSTSSVTGINYTVSTTFYANTINRVGNANFGQTFLGTSSANLKKTDNYSSGLYTVNYNYLLDDNNGIAQQTYTVNGTVVEVENYTY